GSNSEPLDVGRRVRLVTGAMRRALDARDRGCVVCGSPPIMCDATHLISWIDGGDTKVSTLALLCRRHHVDLHNGHWHITILDGVIHVARPSWAEPAPTLTRARRAPPPHPHPPAPAPHAPRRHRPSHKAGRPRRTPIHRDVRRRRTPIHPTARRPST